MLNVLDGIKHDPAALGQEARILFEVLVLSIIFINTQISVEFQLGAGSRKGMAVLLQLYGGLDIYRGVHAARHETFPDHLVETEFISGQLVLQGCRRVFHMCRTDRLVRVLAVAAVLSRSRSVGHIVLAVICRDIGACCSCGFIADTDGVGTQVGDISILIKLLRHTHGLLRGHVQRPGGLLLHRGGRKRPRRIFDTLGFLHLRHQDLLSPHVVYDLRSLFRRGKLFLPAVLPVIQGFDGFGLILQHSLYRMVFLRNEGCDLRIPVADHAQRD